MDLAISMASEADQAVTQLCRFVQLAQARKLPVLPQVGGTAVVTVGFFLVEYATAQGGSNAHHAIELLLADEVTPLAAQVQFILRGDHRLRGAVHAFLIEKQAADLMATGQYGLSKAQGAT